MASISPINSQTYYKNKLNVVSPKETILSNYYSKIDQVWNYAYDIETIQVQSAIGSVDYYPLEVRATTVFEPKTQDSRGDDWREFLFKERDFNLPYGLYIQWKNSYWIVYNKNNFAYATNGVVCRRCPTTFNWIDEWGNLRKYPVVIGKPKEASNYVNVQFTNPGGFNQFILQLDEHSRLIKPNDRFMIGNPGWWSSYIVQGGGVGNYMNEETMDYSTAGLLQLICYIYEGNDDTDNLQIGVAQYYQKIFSIALDQTSISQSVGFTTKLIPTVKKGDNVKTDVSLLWESSNSDIVTVDENGVILLISEGEATITCSMEKNSLVFAAVAISVSQSISDDSYEIIVYPNTENIKQGKSVTYQVNYYHNDILTVPNTLNINLISNNVPKNYYKYTQSGNTFTIENIQKYFDSSLSIAISADDINITKEYWLMGEI